MLRNRIKSNSGATLLIALLFFLLCAMAGSIILAAGSASAGGQAGVKEQEQSYYTVTSAAQLIRGEIEEQQFGYYTKTTTPQGGTSTIEQDYIAKPTSNLKTLLTKAGDYIFANEKDYTDQITIRPADSSQYPELTEVSGEFRMDAKTYNIEIILRIKDAKGEGMYTCKVSIPASGEVKKETINSTGNISTKEIRTDVKWGTAIIVKA